MLREALGGRRIAITGATGFLGTALVERLLRAVPDVEVAVLVRPGRRSAVERVRREVLRNNCFDRLRSELGDRPSSPSFDEVIERRLLVMAGDIGAEGLGLDEEGRRILAGATTVIHSAATVSFDSPLDSAVEINLLGPSRVAATLLDLHAPAAAGEGTPLPHLVAVSTAYVAGSRRGGSPEALLSDTPWATEVAWKPEVAAARQARSGADADSRDPERLDGFHRAARAELGGAGVPLLAERAERLREEWVNDRMVQLGKARAQALGWPDAYAYTKALGERALLANRGPLPVSIVRPSIIESALAEPVPGWIRGFRMADPVVISYAKGLLKEFPGIPEGVIDVIPVDLVVASILAVAARGPLDEPDVFHAASGARNPLRYRQLVDLIRTWFTEHPLADSRDQPINVPEWSFPGRQAVQRQLRQATRALGATEKLMHSLPLRGKQAELSSRLEERKEEATRALSYVELYGAYTETEAIFSVDRLITLWETLGPEDQRDFCFDPAVIDWERFCHDIYLPSVVAHARVRLAPGPSSGKRRSAHGATGLSREERGRRAVLSPERNLAVFDLENTLIASNVVDSYSWLATRHRSDADRVRFVARTLLEAPRLLSLDRVDRGDFLRYFYRRYEGAPVDRLRHDGWDLFADQVLTKSFPAGIRRVREHRALGHRTLLITGALDVVINPLRPLFDDVVCTSLGERAGRFDGEMVDAPPTGEARALIMADYARLHDLDLADSVAYADSASDLPMLEAVGHPVAVNPETRLASIARKRGWHTEHWPKAPGGPRPLLPIGPRR
ncbi:MAG: HAD-IB family phosphatase [Actinomycetota bacterium]|nr:HAD-IB family phosphatase [Actinomycetota bacterium]